MWIFKITDTVWNKTADILACLSVHNSNIYAYRVLQSVTTLKLMMTNACETAVHILNAKALQTFPWADFNLDTISCLSNETSITQI